MADRARPALPDALTRLSRLEFLEPAERVLMSRVQGRTHANVAAFLEAIAGAKRVALAATCRAGRMDAFERLVRLLHEGTQQEALFRRLETRLEEGMPPGYSFAANPSLGTRPFLAGATWAVLALAWHARLGRRSNALCVDPDEALDPGFEEAFRRDREAPVSAESAELAIWRRTREPADAARPEAGADDYLALLRLLDGLLYRQARADVSYLAGQLGRPLPPGADARLMRGTLSAYREQFIVRGATDARFGALVGHHVSPDVAAAIAGAVTTWGGEAIPSA